MIINWLLDQPSDDLQAGEGSSYDGIKDEDGPSDIKRMKKLKDKYINLNVNNLNFKCVKFEFYFF